MGAIEVGESIAVNGACQTVAALRKGSFICDLLPETLRVTNLGKLRAGVRVNLERAVRPGDRLGGHIVNGHIDGTGRVKVADNARQPCSSCRQGCSDTSCQRDPWP